MMGLSSRVAMAAIAAALATTALAQTADTTLPQGVEWAVSPATLLEKTPWGRGGAQGQATQGAALVKCAYDARGALSQCEAIDERPAGYSFGKSAVALAKRARLKSALDDGSALTPGSITFVVMFREEDRSRNAPRTSGSAQRQTDTNSPARERAQEAARNDRATRELNRNP
jgi:hypothetical protein